MNKEDKGCLSLMLQEQDKVYIEVNGKSLDIIVKDIRVSGKRVWLIFKACPDDVKIKRIQQRNNINK